jgi:hypothetical protein
MIIFISLFIILILGFLIFDAFCEMIVNGSSFWNSFYFVWHNRICNLFFQKKLLQYNNFIEKNGKYYFLQKETFAYLDYDEYVHFNIFQKNKIIDVEYSITNDTVQLRTTDLKNLKKNDHYYGRWMNQYYKNLQTSKTFDGNYFSIIDTLFQIAIQNQKSSTIDWNQHKQKMIFLLERELSTT